MLLALLLAAQTPAIPTPRTTCLTCAASRAPARRSRFRLDPAAADTPTAKDRAIQEDGSRCAVIGARQCTHKPRTIFRTDFPR